MSKINLYLNNGYVDFRSIRDAGFPFTLIIGGRGTGKTYGALRSCVEDDVPFMFMRRRQTQVDIINKPEFSPIRPICRDTGEQITNRPLVRGISGFYRYEIEDGKEKITGQPLGFTCALSTLSNVRGFDASHVRMLIYDEFIPEKGERILPSESDTLFNAYETINRNRELAGNAPLQLVCMANANDLSTPVLSALGLIRRLDRMAKTGQEIYADVKRGLLVVLLHDSPISGAKGDTALYRLTTGSEFADMALDNTFSYEDRGRIISRPLAEFRPLAAVGEICIYEHKSRRTIYVTTHTAGAPVTFGAGETELQRFRRAFGWLWREYMEDNIEFEEYLAQIIFCKIFA